MAAKDKIIATQEKIIKQNQPKKWSLGIGAGYGLAGSKPGAFLGLVVSRKLISW